MTDQWGRSMPHGQGRMAPGMPGVPGIPAMPVRADGQMVAARAVSLVLCLPGILVTGYAALLIFVFAAWGREEFGGTGVWGILGFIPLVVQVMAVICAVMSCVKKEKKTVLVLAGASAALTLSILLLVVVARVLVAV
ncbi:hypothetical protein [Corynebacterium variabile]|uniref:hypothetical protein n=1 Tax=Corynebacterium variabile TaxID=1727 RepID=UPI003A8E3AC9